MENFTLDQRKDLKVIVAFIRIFCAARHQGQVATAIPAALCLKGAKAVPLCVDCRQLLDYALAKRRNCPLDPKPSCKNCRIHCYSSEYRARIREIMAFAGRRMILRGRLDYLWHYLF